MQVNKESKIPTGSQLRGEVGIPRKTEHGQLGCLGGELVFELRPE